jgi:putative transcriptional regulator
MYDHVSSILTKARIKELLKRNNMTREDLAKLTGATPKTLDAIESGKYDPPLSIAYKLAAALNVPVEDLYADRPERKVSKRA